MKTRVALIWTLAFLGLLLEDGRAEDPGAQTRRDIASLESDWAEAIESHDPMRLDRILARDYVLTTPDGQLIDKPHLLENFRSPPKAAPVIEEIETLELAIKLYGDTAIVTSRFTLKGRSDGKTFVTPFRHTDIFVKQTGRWQCVSRQATRIVAAPRHSS